MGPRKGPEEIWCCTARRREASRHGVGGRGRAYGLFRRGTGTVGQRFGVAGEILSGPEMAAKMGRAVGRNVRFNEVPFDVYRGLGFPGADDLGNMFQWQAMLGDEFLRARDPERSRSLNPELLSFDAWLGANANRIPID
jgi:hypothetical protein